ncbi:MAG: hypothetical protein KatS3mg090_0367 [Patescibacteria group bacterium]|nr:MAG: hypothetical protein KatS3mg090_0367 [Patescibacteria group bacterium]
MPKDSGIKYYQAKVHCRGCGTSFEVGSTKDYIEVEVCSNCHPFYTGEQKFIDTKGLVEKFQRKQQLAKEFKKKSKETKSNKKKQVNQSLKDLLQNL